MDKGLLARLVEHQNEVEAIAAEGHALLGGEPPADAMAISRLRWQMVRALTAYQQFKHREIFEPAIARGDPELRRMSEALKTDCVAMGEAFTAYVQEWSARGTAGVWPEYRTAALAMNAQIRRHLQREQRNVTSLFRAARVGHATVWPMRS